MSKLPHTLALLLCLSAATPLFAQDEAAAEAPAEAVEGEQAQTNDLSLGTEVGADDGPGSIYVAATFDSWEQRCVRSTNGSDPCQLYQLLKDAEGNSVAEFTMFGLPNGGEAVAGATVVAPLETLLTEALVLQVDDAKAKIYPFSWCSPIGCVARIGFTQAEVDGFKKGAKATLTIVPVVAPDKKVVLDVSLKGFTAGFTAVAEANAKADAAAVEAGAEPAPAP